MEKLLYTTLSETFQYEIPKIKGSRFIATLIPISTKEEIDKELTKIRKKYFDATHNCYAWRYWVDANQDLFLNRNITSHQERANDDWEPSNTAWKPILTVLNWKQIHNILAIVTRYFWWTLLWVWWLIQAYTESTKQALEHAPTIQKEITKELNINYIYDQVSILQYLFSKFETKILTEKYDEKIEQTIAVNVAYYDALIKELIDKQIKYQQ